MEGDAVEGQVVRLNREEFLQALGEMKTGKAPGPSEASLELIAACGGVGIQVMVVFCQSPRWIWNGVECIAVQIFKLLLLLSYHRRLRLILRSARAARGRRSG